MHDYEGDDRRHNKFSNIQHPFIFKPEFTLGSMIAIAGTVFGGFMYVAEIDKGVSQNTEEIKHVRELQKVQNGKMEQAIHNVEKQYEKIDDKLDMLINRELSIKRHGAQP